MVNGVDGVNAERHAGVIRNGLGEQSLTRGGTATSKGGWYARVSWRCSVDAWHEWRAAWAGSAGRALISEDRARPLLTGQCSRTCEEETTMRKFSKTVPVVLTLLAMVSLASIASAESYNATRITRIGTDADGAVYLIWEGDPPSETCGASFGWVVIAATANQAAKDLALSLFESGRSARIDTSGCEGTYERVSLLYSSN
jgi:hypothetical protein